MADFSFCRLLLHCDSYLLCRNLKVFICQLLEPFRSHCPPISLSQTMFLEQEFSCVCVSVCAVYVRLHACYRFMWKQFPSTVCTRFQEGLVGDKHLSRWPATILRKMWGFFVCFVLKLKEKTSKKRKIIENLLVFQWV